MNVRNVRQFIAVLMMVCLGALLGSCGSYSGYVADHWPRWAGGMPGDVPPRPGAPGYNDYIAHRPTDRDAAPPALAGQPAVAGQSGNTPAARSANPAPDNSTIAPGGLY